MVPKVNTLHAPLKAIAVSGLFFTWVNLTVKIFNIACQIISISPEEETLKAISKVVCENYEEHYIDDEIELILGKCLCETCRKTN